MRLSSLSLVFLLLFCTINNAGAQTSIIDSLRKVAREKKDTLRALALCDLTLEFRTKGQLDSASFYGMQALTVSRELKYNHGEAFALYQMGIIASTRADYVDALQKLSQSADL